MCVHADQPLHNKHTYYITDSTQFVPIDYTLAASRLAAMG